MLTYYEYAALFKTPHGLADDLMLVFKHPVKIWVLSSRHSGWKPLPEKTSAFLSSAENLSLTLRASVDLWERLPAAIP
jgi:hypothetical protein